MHMNAHECTQKAHDGAWEITVDGEVSHIEKGCVEVIRFILEKRTRMNWCRTVRLEVFRP